MSDESQGREHDKPQADAAPEVEDTATAAAQAEPDPLEVLKAEVEDLRDQRLRMAAEMENLRRRTAQTPENCARHVRVGPRNAAGRPGSGLLGPATAARERKRLVGAGLGVLLETAGRCQTCRISVSRRLHGSKPS